MNVIIELDTEGVARLLGLSRQHVTKRVTKQLDFPPPSTNTSQRNRRWKRSDVLEFKAGKRWNRHAN